MFYASWNLRVTYLSDFYRNHEPVKKIFLGMSLLYQLNVFLFIRTLSDRMGSRSSPTQVFQETAVMLIEGGAVQSGDQVGTNLTGSSDGLVAP